MPENAVDEVVDLNMRIREKAMFQIEMYAQGQWIVVGHGTTRDLADEEMARRAATTPGFKFRVRPVKDDPATLPGAGDDGSISETSTGARLVGLKMARDKGLVRNTEEVDKLLAAMGKNATSLGESLDALTEAEDALEEAAEKVSRAELRKMDIKRAKREKRGKGRATAKQRAASRKNAKKATRSMGRALTIRKKNRTAKLRARIRGTKDE